MTTTIDALPEVQMPELDEVVGQLTTKSKQLADLWAEAGPERDVQKIKSLSGSSEERVTQLRTLNDELAALGVKKDQLEVIRKSQQFARLGDILGVPNGADTPQPAGRKSFGEQFLKSEARRTKGVESMLDVDVKAVLATTAGWAPEVTRSGQVIMSAQRPVQVTDLIPSIPTSQSAYRYMEETTFTNAAAETAEQGLYGEATLVLTEQTSIVRKVGVWLPVTDEQFEDEPAAEAYVNQRLPVMLQQRLDLQILVGNGTAPNLRGVNNVVGIQTQAKGADPVPDAIYKAMTLVRVTGRATPNAVVIHPTDWQDVKLLRTVDGVYIWGNPSQAGPDSIWGLRVVESDAQTLNTAVVGDWANYSLLALRRGIEVKMTDSHASDFSNGRMAIRADMRAALVFLRPAAFATVTGI